MRMRWVKPEFYSDPWFVKRPPLTRLLYQGLWCFADDAGRFVADIALIHGQLLALDPRKAVERSMKELEDGGRLVLWEANGLRYGLIPMFAVHQRIDKPQRSVIPAPPKDVAEAVEKRLRSHPRWSSRFEQNVTRMLRDDYKNGTGVFAECSRNTPEASRARASGPRDQGTKGPENQGTEGGTPTGKATAFGELHARFLVVHEECEKVTLEKFAEICRVNPRADVGSIIERLRLEVQGMEWPWRDRNAAQVLRSRVMYGELDAQREREALKGARAGSGVKQTAPLSAEELRDRVEGRKLDAAGGAENAR